MRAALLLVLAGCVGAADVITPSDVNMMATLTDGRVMLAGGNTGITVIASCACFDADSGVWSTLEDMAHARARATLTRLADGTLLAVGGFTYSGNVAETERYSPDTGHWTPADSEPIATNQHSATLLADGSVIVIGGLTSGNASTSQVLRFDPATNGWTARASMIHPRHDHLAVLLPDGRILCTGGYVNGGPSSGPSATTDLYDPATDSWVNAPDLSVARYDHTGALLPDGTVAVTNGTSMEIYHPSTNTWSAPTTVPHHHDEIAAMQLYDGKLLLIGGRDDADLYDPSTTTWSTPGCISLAHSRYFHPSALAGDGRAVIAAGATGSAMCGDAEVFGQHLDFTAIPAHQAGDPPIALSASSSAGLPVTFTVLSGPATVTGSSLTIAGPGTVLVRAEQSGDATWFPAARVRSFTVSPASGGSGTSATGTGSGSGSGGPPLRGKPTDGTKNFFCGLGSGLAGLLIACGLGMRHRGRRG